MKFEEPRFGHRCHILYNSTFDISSSPPTLNMDVIFTCLPLERGQYSTALNSGQIALRCRILHDLKCPTKIMISRAYLKI